MSLDAIRAVTGPLVHSATSVAIVGAALEARAAGLPLDPRLAPLVADVLSTLGLSEEVAGLGQREAAGALAEIRAFSAMNLKLLAGAGRGLGWHHTEPEILQAIGASTHGLGERLKGPIGQALDGLAARLDGEGAAFLDVGAGVGKLAIDVATAFPRLRVVGVDPWAPSLELARSNVAAAALGDRITLRQEGGEDVRDRDAFDLAWVAAPFMAETVLPALLGRVGTALKPGGWVLLALAALVSAPDPRVAAVWRVRVTTWGGGLTTTADAEALLKTAGFSEVRTLPTPPGAVAALVAGRRPAA